MMKMKIFCVYGCFIASRYSKGGRKSHRIALNAIAFLDTHVDKVVELSGLCVYNISVIIILYCYLRYTDKLLDAFFLFFTVILSEFHEKPRRKG